MTTHTQIVPSLSPVVLAFFILFTFTSTAVFAEETRIQIQQSIPETTAAQKPKESSPRKSKNGEPVSQLARAELIAVQTLFGLGVGAEITRSICQPDCKSIAPIYAAWAGGAALGLGSSLFLSRNGITAGQATTYNSGATWGLWNSIALYQMLDPNTNNLLRIPLAGSAIGLGSAALAWNLFEPTAGTVSLANSGQIWTTAITTLIHGTTGFAATKPLLWGSLLAASNVGLVTGALLAHKFPMSRNRAFLIDGGGVLGGLTGAALYALVKRNKHQPLEGYMATTLAGTILGLGTATYFSRSWDLDDDTAAQLFINPTDGGTIVGLAGRF